MSLKITVCSSRTFYLSLITAGGGVWGVLFVTKDEHFGGAGQVHPGRTSLEQVSKTQKIPS